MSRESILLIRAEIYNAPKCVALYMCVAQISTPDTTKSVLNAWMMLKRWTKNLHQDSSAYYKRAAEASLVTALVLGASSGLSNLVLEVIDPTTTWVNVAHIVLGMTGLSTTIIV